MSKEASLRYVLAIPARLHSVRLPEKLLLAETGQAVLAQTIEKGKEAAALVGRSSAGVVVVCDHERLAEVAESAGVRAVMTGDCDSGTERIATALNEIDEAEVIVNLQADEPEMPARWIADCAESLAADESTDVATVAVPIDPGDSDLNDSNVVKVVLDHQSNALYFSREAIPHVREGGITPQPRALRHIGLYAYRRSFLYHYGALPKSDLEESERLEQLRFLQAGCRVRVIVKPAEEHPGEGIDTPEQYARFVQRCASR